ncbi:MAG: type I DNA topoisomerase [Pseudomonadota bacterium]|nr:type I DNA topoisomerase [Pseudomonadota bacterium]
MKVVVVESPAKAKTINKYLGSDYHVIASYGHIRDLPRKDGSVRPDEDFAMSWETDPRAEKQIKAIAQAVRGADHLYLATDPDREGEAISWHIRNVLKERKMLEGLPVQRIVFNEITKSAVLDALANPRDLTDELVEAYLARRALDYLVGFTLSPVLWRKLPGSRSAGRVQSVALRLIAEREAEIEAFKAEEYWSVDVNLRTRERKSLSARLVQLDGVKLGKMDLPNQAAADAAVAALQDTTYQVLGVEKKRVRRNPAPPFTTSTLQQEASRKLRFGATRTMRIAQRLYEGIDIGGETVGLITYMRTDGVQMGQEAIGAIRGVIAGQAGDRYLPPKPRVYRTKAKNAQEAHEAIRPTDPARLPRDLAARLSDEDLKLYELIWKRAVASQMASAELDQTAVTIETAHRRAQVRATGSVVVFDGFLKLYVEDRDERASDDGDDNSRLLPPLAEGDALALQKINPEQHFTQPPPRYSEASLVRKMEELGIGRPSTYASIIQVLQDRDYVTLDNRRFVPGGRGRIVTAFLVNFFTRYVEYTFTADLEGQLDDISAGKLNWQAVLRDFWEAFSAAIDGTKDLTVRQVLDALDKDLGEHFFPLDAAGQPTRACPQCGDGRLGLKLGKFGAFIGCANYPDCRYTRQLTVNNGDDGTVGDDSGVRLLGKDPETGLDVTLRRGPFGDYVQLGEATGEGKKKTKPKRASLAKGMVPAEVTLETALGLLSLPREVGPHPDSGEPITAGIGRFGDYVKHQSTYKSLTDGDDVLTIGLNRAVDLIAQAPQRTPAKALGDHPDDGVPVTIHSGRYGPYVQHHKVRATLPKGVAEDSVTLAQAVELIAAKAAKAGTGKAPTKGAKAKTTKAKTGKAKTTGAKTTGAKTAKSKTTKAKSSGAKTKSRGAKSATA